MDGFEIKIRENKRGGWKEHIPFTEDYQEFIKKINAIIEKYGGKTKGKYVLNYKINGGYGKNKETGTTLKYDWDGDLGMVYGIIKIFNPKDYDPDNAIEFKNEEWSEGDGSG